MNLNYRGINFGADPEVFFANAKGEIIGAEKVMPKEGIWQQEHDWSDPTGEKMRNVYRHVIVDGIAGEFNPSPATCRQTFSRNLQVGFQYLQDYLTRNHKDTTVSFARSITVTKEEMESISPANQQLGCSPSLNAYGDFPMPTLTPENMYQRSAGGHLHFGAVDSVTLNLFKTKPDLVVRIMDIVVGNTCVMLDPDEGNKIRRVMYGRAGEYRLPKHGLEYRVLSNFWLKHYTVMSFVFSLARLAINIAADEAATKELLGRVNLGKIQEAINTNDLKLAQKNFDEYKDFLKDIRFRGDSDRQYNPLEAERLEKFEHVAKKGLDAYFKRDSLEHWLDRNDVGGSGTGWEIFVSKIHLSKIHLKPIEKAQVAVGAAVTKFTSVF